MSFLGRFLVEQGAVTEAQLADGLRYQHEQNRRIGEVAVERGMLTPDQVEVIRGRQDDDPRLFGDIAVGARQLSRRSLDNLLFFQKIQHTYLGEALLVLGHIDRVRYQELMGRHYTLRDKGRVSLRYLQEFFAENRVVECLFSALTRAVQRTSQEETAIVSLGKAFTPADYPERALFEGTVLDGRRFSAAIGLTAPLAAQLGSLPAFYETVLHYFGDMLRDVALLLESSRIIRGGLPPAGCEDCLTVQAHTPTGGLLLVFWLAQAPA